MMKARTIAAFSIFTLIITAPALLIAAGTPSGTNIFNQATVTYNVGSSQFTAQTNITTTRVAELIDIDVLWQDATPVRVNPGDTAQAASFIITNIGNGTDSLLLEINNRLDGDDFDPVQRGIYFDSNNNGRYDHESDIRYIEGLNDPVLEADESVMVFALNDIIPDLSNNDRGNTELIASSRVGTGNPGTVFPGNGDFGMDAVLGTSGGDDSDIAEYIIGSAVISLHKSVTITDMYGGSEPTTGAILTYTILVTASGSGVARNVVITDAIPEYTTYNPGTLSLDSNPITDEADTDPGDVGYSIQGSVTVDLGDISIPSQEHTITFNVTIN